MALFAMLFGTRRTSALEHNRGLVLAMAFESLLKLGAMLSVGALVFFGLPETSALAPTRPNNVDGFAPLVVLGALAMFTLPHQFHLGVVECQDPRHLRQARWQFPLYMLLIALPTLPLARAGEARLAAFGVPSDLYVLALPLSQGHTGIALWAFLGGLSAATGMVILATLALSLMIGNHWLTPLLLLRPWARQPTIDLPSTVLLQRRLAILAVIALPILQPIRVLVVDNDEAVLRGMQSLLLGWQCQVLTASTSKAAERLTEQPPPDLLLLDYHLDDGDTGLALWQRLRQHWGEIPAIVISADHSTALEEAVRLAGAHLLHKPLKPLALKSLMARLLGSY